MPRASRPLLQRARHADRVEAGVDEAGRGSLAGPVVAAAVVWDPDVEDDRLALLRDSKKLTPKQREKARAFVLERAVAFGVGVVDAARIDEVNILNATYEAMHAALDALDQKADVEAILVDGDRFRTYLSLRTGEFVPHACVIEGDNTFMSIAAASILAKTHRDALMTELARDAAVAGFGWERNKGYGTAQHMDALRRLGPAPLHRRTFLKFLDAPPQDAPPQDAPPQDAPPQDAPRQDAVAESAPPV
jgi:ribonuclease HII